MIKTSTRSVFVAWFFAVISACGGGGAVVVTDPTQGAGGDSQFVINNSSSQSICYVHISPTSDGNWGPDRLGASEVIASGQTRGWSFPAGLYDIQLQSCEHTNLLERRSLAFAPGDGLQLDFRTPE